MSATSRASSCAATPCAHPPPRPPPRRNRSCTGGCQRRTNATVNAWPNWRGLHRHTSAAIPGLRDGPTRPTARRQTRHPKAERKWLTTSVVEDAAEVIAQVINEATRRDPHAATGSPWSTATATRSTLSAPRHAATTCRSPSSSTSCVCRTHSWRCLIECRVGSTLWVAAIRLDATTPLCPYRRPIVNMCRRRSPPSRLKRTPELSFSTPVPGSCLVPTPSIEAVFVSFGLASG